MQRNITAKNIVSLFFINSLFLVINVKYIVYSFIFPTLIILLYRAFNLNVTSASEVYTII